jgi:hypothetical protein
VDNQLDEVNVKERDGTGLRNSQLHTNQVIANGTAKLDLNKLPSDPLNGNAIADIGAVVQKVAGTATYKIAYCSDGKDFEVNVYLENDEVKKEMVNDGGNNPTAYEVGSNVLVCQ